MHRRSVSRLVSLRQYSAKKYDTICSRLQRWTAGGMRRDRWISRCDWISIGDRAECTDRGYIQISGLSAVHGGSATYWERLMTIEGQAVLVTGANRGIGRALVGEPLRRGAKRGY